MKLCEVVKLVFKTVPIINLRRPQRASAELLEGFEQINNKFSQLLKDGELSGMQCFNPSTVKNYESLIYAGKFLYLKIDLSADKKRIIAAVDDVIGKAQKQIGTHTGKGTQKGAAQRDKAKAVYFNFFKYYIKDGLAYEKACGKTSDDSGIEIENIKRRYLRELKKKITPGLQKMSPKKKIKTWPEIRSQLKSLPDILKEDR
jgi:hypothetical protein